MIVRRETDLTKMTPQQFVAMPREEQMQIAMAAAAQVIVGQRLIDGPEDLADLLSGEKEKRAGFAEPPSRFRRPGEDSE